MARDDSPTLHGLPVTSVPRTLCELAGLVDVPTLRGYVIDACQRRQTTLVAVGAAVDRLGPVRGAGRLRSVLGELDAERCDSVLEHRLRRRLRAEGLRPHPGPVAVPIDGRTLHLDIAWPVQRVGIEALGLAWHSSRTDLDVDTLRHNAIQRAGWTVLHAGWTQLEDDRRFRVLVAQLRALLSSSR